MPLISSIFGQLKTSVGIAPAPRPGVEPSKSTAVVEFDAVLSEVSTRSNQVTDHPVEDGSNISDHVIRDPEEIQIDGIITNTPASLLTALAASSTRAEELYDELKTLEENREPISVFTSKREFENMIITRLSRTRNASIGDAVQFSMTLREIKTIQSEVVEAPVRDSKQKKQDLGKKPTAAATTAQSETMASKLLSWLGL